MTYDIDIDSYIGYPCSKQWVKSELARKKGKPVTVRISSPGGSVDDGLDIYQQFRDHGGVTAYIHGMTASAATFLAMGAKKIVMSKHALMLIHCSSTWNEEWGYMNSQEIENAIERLNSNKRTADTIDGVQVNIYATKCGKTAKEVYDLMKEERWLTAEECLAFGLVDEISDEGNAVALDDDMRRHFVACGLPLPSVPSAPAAVADDDARTRSAFRVIFDALAHALSFGAVKPTADGDNSEVGSIKDNFDMDKDLNVGTATVEEVAAANTGAEAPAQLVALLGEEAALASVGVLSPETVAAIEQRLVQAAEADAELATARKNAAALAASVQELAAQDGDESHAAVPSLENGDAAQAYNPTTPVAEIMKRFA